MTAAELNEELRALVDLNQRLSERIETLTRRLTRHFNANPPPVPQHWPPRTRDDEDDGSD
jgi:hypothetical protein